MAHVDRFPHATTIKFVHASTGINYFCLQKSLAH